MTVSPAVAEETRLLARVLDTFLREDVLGVRSRGSLQARPDGPWLRISHDHGTALVPVRPDGFLCDLATREPLLVQADRTVGSLAGVLAFFRAGVAEPDRAGFDAFARECRDNLDVLRLHARCHGEILDRLRGRPTTGLAGSLVYETLAAYLDHPVYPTARQRYGLTTEDLLRYAPELYPTFPLRWVALPTGALTRRGRLPEWWPRMSDLGLPARLAATHTALPVHPLTAAHSLAAAVSAAGLDDTAHVSRRWYLEVSPTLSMRTVLVRTDPSTHLKLPLPTSTLGLLNRRGIQPGTLVDGSVTGRVLEAVLDREPRFRETILLADEHTYAHAGQEYLATLVRRYPAGLDGTEIVTLAGLLAPAPDGGAFPGSAGGRLVIDDLAGRYFAGDVAALFDAYLGPLLDWHVTLWLRYGIALESHQQNIALVLDRPAGRTRIRLLYKDNDGPRVRLDVLRQALGADAPRAEDFADRRIPVDDGRPLAEVFTTITVHLCAGALAFGLAQADRLPLRAALRTIRERLEDAGRRHADATPLRERVLDADRLPVKSMVTAGTLLTKQRSGATDVNKFYGTTGPNYLRPGWSGG